MFVEYKAFVPNLKVLQGGNVIRLLITNLVQILKYGVRVTRKEFVYSCGFLSGVDSHFFMKNEKKAKTHLPVCVVHLSVNKFHSGRNILFE